MHQAGGLVRGLWNRGAPAFGLRTPDHWAGVGRHAWLALPALSSQDSTRWTFGFFPLGRATFDFKELCSFFKDHRQAGHRFGVLASWDAPSAGVSVACWLADEIDLITPIPKQRQWAIDAFKRAGSTTFVDQPARGAESLLASLMRSWEFAKILSQPTALVDTLCTARACLDVSYGIDRVWFKEHLASHLCLNASSPELYMELIDTWLAARTLDLLLPKTERLEPRRRLRL